MSFSFVNYDGPKLPTDPSVRRTMRQRAMKDVATARRRGQDYGQHNLVQLPVYLKPRRWMEDESIPVETHNVDTVPLLSENGSPLNGSIVAEQRRSRQNFADSLQSTDLSRPSTISPSGVMPRDFILLLKFMPVNGPRLGIATSAQLTSDSIHRQDLFSVQLPGSHKMISFIPGRYGQVPALRHATDCVIAKLRYIMQPPDSRSAKEEVSVLLHYSKALRALQAAIDDEDQRMTSETLCATELLGAFEALGGSPEGRSWIHHIGGAAQLIEVRGAHRFTTTFDLALFMAHVGPIVMDSLLNNTACFLEENQWQQVIRTAICNDESLAAQKDLAIMLWSHLVRISKYFKDATDVVFAQYSSSQATIDILIQRLWNGLKSLLWWLSQAQMQTKSPNRELDGCEEGLSLPWPTFESAKLSPGYINQLALRGTYTMCYILKARLLFALAPSRFHHLEIECQQLASRIIDLGETSTEDEDRKVVWSLFMSQSIWIAKGVLATKQAWEEGWEDRDGVIDRWKFKAWCFAIGRKCPST